MNHYHHNHSLQTAFNAAAAAGFRAKSGYHFDEKTVSLIKVAVRRDINTKIVDNVINSPIENHWLEIQGDYQPLRLPQDEIEFTVRLRDGVFRVYLSRLVIKISGNDGGGTNTRVSAVGVFANNHANKPCVLISISKALCAMELGIVVRELDVILQICNGLVELIGDNSKVEVSSRNRSGAMILGASSPDAIQVISVKPGAVIERSGQHEVRSHLRRGHHRTYKSGRVGWVKAAQVLGDKQEDK